jgi:hypothetical protein
MPGTVGRLAAVCRAGSRRGPCGPAAMAPLQSATANRNPGTEVLKPWQFWSLTLLAAVAVALTATNIVLYGQNRDLQTEIAGRAQYVQQSVQLQALYQEIVKALADLSVRNKDNALVDLLSRRGITVSVTPPAGTAAGATAPGPGEARKSAKDK